MIVKTSSSPVEKFGSGQESAFTIKASAQAFKILASNLYKEKVRAVVRELSCNAYDSHVEAGNLAPFVVHSPNYLEPWFSVKDFGVGIPHDFMMSNTEDKYGYTTVFHSTKNASQDTIGGLGLGRLSAFAYNDSYSVISIVDGVKRNYVIFLAEDGFPTISLLGEEATQEHNGFEVTIPVKSSDFYEFENEIVRFFSNVVSPYKVEGTSRHIINKTPILEGKGWKKYNGGSGTCYAKMGLVWYPIDTDHKIDSFAIVIDFPIGSLEIAPSRESLSYSPDTKRLITERFDEIEKEVAGLIQEKVNKAETEWEAKLILSDIHEGIYGPFASKYTFNYKDIDIKTFYDFSINFVSYSLLSRRGKDKLQTYYAQNLPVSNKYDYYINDEPTYSQKRLRKQLQDSDTIYLLTPSIAAQLDKPGGFEKLSDLPFDKTVRRASVRSPEAGKRILEYINGDFTIPNDFSLDTAEFYVTVGKRELSGQLYDINKRLQELEFIDLRPRLFWVAPSIIHKTGNWIEFFSFTEAYLKTKLAEKIKGISYEKVNSRTQDFFLKLKQIAAFPLVDEIAEKIANNVEPDGELTSLCSRHNIAIEQTTEIQSRIEEFYKAKPMMRLCDSSTYHLKQFETEIKEYV